MGCLFSKGFLKHDEVHPISIRPLYLGDRPRSASPPGKIPHPTILASPDDQTAPVHKVVLINQTVVPKSPKQNGSVSLTSQERRSGSPAQNGKLGLASEKDDNLTNGSDRSTTPANRNEAVTEISEEGGGGGDGGFTHQNRSDSDEKDARLPSRDTDPDRWSRDAEEIVAVNENTDSSRDGDASQTNQNTAGPANEEEADSSTNQNPEAAEAMQFQMPQVAIQKVPDGEGCPITLGTLFGVWTVPWPSLPEQIMRAQHFTFHDSDVILTCYPKSGSHWMWEMLHMLMIGRPEHCRTPKERLMLSFSTQEFFDSLPPPRVFNTHAPFQGFPAAVREGRNRCKMIHLLRNPKDVAVSYYHHLINQVDFEYEGSFHGYLPLFLEGKVPGDSWFDYVLGWEETLKQNPDLSVLTLYYEDVKEDSVSALQKVNEFLELGRDPELLHEIATQCTIARMKAVDEELKEQGPERVNLSKTGENFILRKGEVGDWRNWFSEEDDRRFMEVVREKLQHSSLHFRYTLDEREEKGEREEREEDTTSM